MGNASQEERRLHPMYVPHLPVCPTWVELSAGIGTFDGNLPIMVAEVSQGRSLHLSG